MPRRVNVPKREVLADPIYGSKLVTKIINKVMYDGKKGVAEKAFYNAMEIVGEKNQEGSHGSFGTSLKKRYACARG